MTWNRQCRLTIIVAAVAVLGLRSGVAWGQAVDHWWQELGGSWCDADAGCTHWWNQYEVEVRGRVVLIRHRDRRFLLFRGDIQEKNKDDGRWEIEATTDKGAELKATVTELKGLKELVQGKIKGSLKAKIEGAKQVEISIPIQISEATIEGIVKPEKDKKTGDDKGKGAEDDDDDGDAQGKKRVVLEGKFKGKTASATGEVELKGDFSGDFKAVVQIVVTGVYRVPPSPCSEGGRPLSSEEEGELNERRLKKVEGRLRRKTTFKLIGPQVESNALIRDDAGDDTRSPGRSRWIAEKPKPGESEKSGPISVYAEKARVEARPTEPNTLGKFMRRVSGTVNRIKPRTITLELPPLPVLDHRCAVIDELPKRTLKLVKQHEQKQ